MAQAVTHPSLTLSDAQSAWQRQPVGLVTAVTARCLSVFTKANDEGAFEQAAGKIRRLSLKKKPEKRAIRLAFLLRTL